MNINSLSVTNIPNKEDIKCIASCKFVFNGECQLFNKPCKGKDIKKENCKFAEVDKSRKLTF